MRDPFSFGRNLGLPGAEGKARRRPLLDMLLMIHVEIEAGGRRAAAQRIGAGDGAERVDLAFAARTDLGTGPVGAAQAGEIGALAVRAADPYRVGKRSERMGVGGGNR